MAEFDGFECFQFGPGNYGVTLVNTTSGARLQSNAVACGRQAHAQVTMHGQRPMRFLGVNTMSNGTVVATEFPETCGSTDPLHVHTHKFPLPRLEES